MLRTQSQIEDDVMRSEELIDVAVRTRKESIRSGPSYGVDRIRSGSEVGWDGGIVARPKPHLDEIRSTFHSISISNLKTC